jgi:levanase
MLQIVPNAGMIRLRDASGGEGKLKEERKVTVKEGEIYHLRVKAEGSSLKVYWGNEYKPVIEVQDLAYRTGKLGLNVWNGSVLFQNIIVSDLKGNLGAVVTNKGQWQPNINGKKGMAVNQGKSQQIYNKQAADFVYEGNISLRSDSVATLAFRSSADGTTLSLSEHDPTLDRQKWVITN